MNSDERLDYLVKELCRDSDEYKNIKYKKSDRRALMRSLMNIRRPNPISNEFLREQDLFLKEEAEEKGIVKLADIPVIKDLYNSKFEFGEKISVWQGDITRLDIDAIVNAANSQMLGCFIPCHKCIDNAIHSAAGIQLREECYDYMKMQRKKNKNYEEPTGKAVITFSYNLPCKYVIHTVGPTVSGKPTESLKNDLKSCYESCLNEAVKKGVRSIAFCCISTGEFNFPNYEAALIAVNSVNEFLKANYEKIDRIVFNVFKDLDKEIYIKLLRNYC
ncbi:protein-ADP-ribose hydrolase [uncultured Clostridium sp.]|uniref:protein-ADP-ribose hydrolase n=1 Tax=uncultured Clostridium sp. TaxID=59620 RepID=UPI0025DB8F64|nr:protein-ADP-ribose hydrolase [uncultured Clostridium sp.]